MYYGVCGTKMPDDEDICPACGVQPQVHTALSKRRTMQ